MKKHNFVRSLLASMLAFLMIFGTCATSFAAEPENKPIVYVSIGDSMTNGYGIDGYDGESGIANYANATYGNQFAAWLAGYTGDIVNDQVIFTGTKGTVDHRQLAMSGMRAEDVHWVLELDYKNEALINKLWEYRQDINSWTDNISEKWYGELGFKAGDYRTWDDVVNANYRFADGAAKILDIYNNNPDTNGKYFISSYADGINLDSIKDGITNDKYFPESNDDVAIMGPKYLQISTEFYQKSVEDADIISLALGNTNFGTYMLNEIMDVTMNNDLEKFRSRYDIENVFNLAALDNETESAVRDLIAECDGIIDQMFATLAGGDQDKMEALRNVIIYCITSYAVNYIGAVEAILKLNPDVDIIQIALMNAYADESEEITDTTLGDIVDVLYTPVNAFIAAIPTVMQGANRNLYKDATFYYAEVDSVECLVNVFGGDFYKDAEGKYVEYPGLLNGGEGYTGNEESTVRDRFIDNIVKGQTFDLIEGRVPGVVRDLSVAAIMAYDMKTPTEKATYAATEPGRAKSIALYLAFENATIEAGKGTVTLNSLAALGDLSSAFGGIMTTLQADATSYGCEKYLDAVAGVVVGRANNPLLTSEVLKSLYKAPDQEAAIVAFITGIVKNQVQTNSSVQAIISNGTHESFDDILECLSDTGDHIGCPSVKTVYEDNLNTAITNYKPGLLYAVESTGDLCYLLGLPKTLSDAMVDNPTLSGILCMNARCLIGTGIGGHPSTTGHDALFDAVSTAYSEEYTAKDETIANITYLIKEYYDEAYAYAYAQADQNGYVDTAAAAIDNAIDVIETLDFSDSQMTDELKAQLEAELNAVVVTLEKVKFVLATDAASNVSGLYESVMALKDDLYTHLAGAGAILGQIEYDVKTLIVPVIDAYIAGLKANVEKDIQKTGHKNYTKDTNSFYVAIGGDTVYGTGINLLQDKNYGTLVGEHYGINKSFVVERGLLLNGIFELIDGNKTEIEKADLITYQLDSSSLINSILKETPDWDNYIDAETKALINEVWVQTKAVIEADWVVEGNVILEDVAEKIKTAVLENLPETSTIVESDVDTVINFCISYIQRVIPFAESKKDDVVDEISSLDPMILSYAEKIAYAAVSYVVETKNAVETIQEINKDATLVVVGMYNPVKDLKIEVNGNVIDAGEIFEYVIDATNIYYTAFGAANGNFAFVDVSDAAINGFVGGTYTIEEFVSLASDLSFNMHANKEGNDYIASKIIEAITCDYSVYEQLDSTMHTVKCSICGDADTEAHSFSGTTCTKCDYVKSGSGSTPPTGPTGPSSGGVSKVTYTITFNTNGGSKLDSVKVAEGKTLVAPKAPIKEGYIFDGWYTDSNLTQKYNFSTPVTKAFTLYAKWIESEKISLKFTDIKNDAWYYDVVKTIVEKGLMNGISDTQFAPELEVTRAMFVTILYRVAGEPQVAATTSFADVSADAYYAKAVAWANANGIVNGITESEFAPDNNITREQMAAILYRYAKNETVAGEITYTDKAAISDYALDAINWAYAAGIMTGNEDGSFAPLRNSSRAEAAAVFVRLLG